ncbi:Chitinase 2 [Linum grandiflorum]
MMMMNMKLFVYLYILFLLLNVSDAKGRKKTNNKVMMEYIGATGAPVTFESVPIKAGINFHFILGFAIDADPSGKPTNGKFSPYWADTLTPESISSIKSGHPNLKVMLSLGGWSINDKVLKWKPPNSRSLWISNAISSLTSLITTYHLDGIDVDYETFGRRSSDVDSFAFCIGELISGLKKEQIISVATIAPFHTTVVPYVALFGKYGFYIDYVNYQFYTDKVRSPAAYAEAFAARVKEFGKDKVLPSYEVNGRGIQGDGFFESLSLLQKNGFCVNGVMIFSADASEEGDDQFYYENKSQSFLLNNSTTAGCE